MNIRGMLAPLSRQGLTLYVMLIACAALGPWNPAGVEWAELDRSALQDGEYWRFWTGQFVQASWQQLLLSGAGLVLLQQLFGKELSTVVWLWGYAIVALAVGICMLAFSRFGTFTGLSAVLHGMFAYGAILAMRRDGLLAWGVLILIGAKVIWEQIQGGSAWVQDFIGLPVATDAHLYGFAAGIILAAVMVTAGNRGGDG